MRALWLRWTLRDLRARWLQVLATALVLAVGIGAFAGLGGLQDWRVASADRSLTVSRAHDLRMDLPDGSFARAGTLRSTIGPAAVAAADERLVAPSQIDASRRGSAVVAPAHLIGIGTGDVDRLSVRAGRPGLVLDWNFARFYGLPSSGSVRIAGLGRVRYTGLGVIPEHFLIVGAAGISGAESSLAIVYAPLADVQRASGRDGQVNQLVLRLAPGGSGAVVERRLRTAFPGARLTRAADEPVTRIMYRDAANDQKTYRAFALLLILGAALAAFNLVSRVVEAQRREIGIGMALGMTPRALARRPLALGLQIGLLGAALSVPVGIGLAELIKSLFREYLPLPAYASTFPTRLYVVGAVLGVTLPLLAGLLPVRRAVSVAPVEAIRTSHRGGTGGWTTRLRHLVVPGGELVRLPLRNLARSPRRTVMTFVGLGAVMTAVVGVLGMVDSVADIAQRQKAATLGATPERVEVTLAGVLPRDGAVVRTVAATPGVRAAEPGLTVEAEAARAGRSIPLALSFVDPASRVWRPKASSGSVADGVLLAEKAATDLGVGPGDPIRVRVGAQEATLRVAGVHASPIRPLAYVRQDAAARFGLAGRANTVALVPAQGTRPGALEQALFGRPGVGSVRPAAADAEALETTIASFRSAIEIVALMTLGLALLVAFTSTSVALDERRREYATMQAFGLLPRTGLRVAMTESLVTGLAGTALGLALGLAVAAWITHGLLPDTFPELSARVTLAPASIATALVVGILAVSAAPLLVLRRLRRMDIPATLRVME